MIGAILIVVNGMALATTPPAAQRDGHVAVALASVARWPGVERIALDAAQSNATVDTASRSCTVHVTHAAVANVGAASLARCLGGSASFDPATQTLSITLLDSQAITSPTPFDPRAPQAPPMRLFTPEPPPPSPRVMETGSPHPRRTAIPIVTTIPPR